MLYGIYIFIFVLVKISDIQEWEKLRQEERENFLYDFEKERKQELGKNLRIWLIASLLPLTIDYAFLYFLFHIGA